MFTAHSTYPPPSSTKFLVMAACSLVTMIAVESLTPTKVSRAQIVAQSLS
jgi:hypothetical protein